MSLVTSVDAVSDTHVHEPESNDVPEGISIHLSSHANPADEYDDRFLSPEPEKGSISFSFSPDDAPRHDTAPITPHAETPSASHDPAGVHRASVAVAEAPAEAPAVEALAEDHTIEAHVANEEPTHDAQATHEVHPAEAGSDAETAMSADESKPAPPSSATADIVGNLISRALTFRIK